MDCCNYPEYRAAPYYYYPGQYPPYWPGGAHYPPAPAPAYPAPHHVQPPRDPDYGHAQAHHMPTDYGYGGKDRLRRTRERPGDSHRGALEWAEASYLPPVSDSVRDTPWSYYQNGCNGWQSGGGRSGYPVRPLALQGGFPPPPLAYPHRDPLRGMAAMQATQAITPDKATACTWDQYRGREADERNTPFAPLPPAASPAPRHRQPRAERSREETKTGAERSRKNKSPKSAVREEPPAEVLPPAKPMPDAVPLPAFQQAFGSTEIGRFSEAFTSAGAITEDMVSRAISQGLLGEWREAGWGEGREGWAEAEEPQWTARGKQIKCEDTY